MDGFMPIKTGWDATKEIREREAATGCTNGLIIIGVTGATTSEDARKCLDFGMTDFIAKVELSFFVSQMNLFNICNLFHLYPNCAEPKIFFFQPANRPRFDQCQDSVLD